MVASSSLARMFAALSATNEAILHSSSDKDLCQRVCDAAVDSGRFLGTAIFFAEDNTPWFQLAAAAGPFVHLIEQFRFSSDPSTADGRGLGGEAFRTGKICIGNDIMHDPRTRPWLVLAEQSNLKSVVAVPLLRDGRPAGLIYFFLGEDQGRLDNRSTRLMQSMAENVSFGMEMFRRDEQRDRLTHMLGAISATNEAIIRASSRQELFQLVCDAVMTGGKFTSATIALADGGDFLRIVASSGPDAGFARTLRLAIDERHPEGRGMVGTAFRTCEPCYTNNIRIDPRTEFWRDSPGPTKSGAGLPLLRDGRSVGVLLFLSDEADAFTPRLIELLQRLAENVSFAMEMLEREDNRRAAELSKDRLTRMFSALSATNEAIMRATSRGDLLQRVCEAAVVGGQFTSTTIALVRPKQEFLDIAAAAGPDRLGAISVRLSVDPSRPEGSGLSGRAFRSCRPCISNDYLADARTAHFYDTIRASGARSGAALPLMNRGGAIGVLMFFSTELGAFTPELVQLLQRLADNISFGLDNFDRAEQKKEADEHIKYLATHDGLTDLPNRALFAQLLNEAIKFTDLESRRLALLFIDLDRFKVINDTLGHADGDTLLVEIAARLRNALRKSDMVARIGGDEFVALLPHVSERSEAMVVAQKLLSAVMTPVNLRGHECRVTASIGIALYPENGSDGQTLIKNADMAMYAAKDEGKNTVKFFSCDIKTQSIERLMLETNLRKAIERGEFMLHYQPKLDLNNGQITGVEALLRWSQPDIGMIPPSQFIPIAEETGLIVPIGRWVLRTACEQHVAWRRQGLPPFYMAINLSPRQFQQDNLVQDIDEILSVTGMQPDLLEIEITESMVMQNTERANAVLSALKARGIRIAMDDFGTGYSSMSLIKQFPFDTLKIDRAFIRDLPENKDDRAIAEAIINLGKALGVKIVAEGVETDSQQTFLRERACDEIQGYLFSRPIPAERIADFFDLPMAKSPSLQPRGPASQFDSPHSGWASTSENI
ncbi:MAG: EAL domain-containing protein [Pseudomonadota bacterium]